MEQQNSFEQNPRRPSDFEKQLYGMMEEQVAKTGGGAIIINSKEITYRHIKELEKLMFDERLKLLEPIVRNNSFGLEDVLKCLKRHSDVTKNGFSMRELVSIRRRFPSMVYDVVRTYFENQSCGGKLQLFEITNTYTHPWFGIGSVRCNQSVNPPKISVPLGYPPEPSNYQVFSGE